MTNSLSTVVHYIIGGVCGGIISILLIAIAILTLLVCILNHMKKKPHGENHNGLSKEESK